MAQEDPIYERVMKDKTLRVFALQGPLPQTFRDQDEFKGFDADVFNYIARKLGVEVEPVWGQSASMVPMVSSGRADISIAYYRTPEREEVLDFTDPYKWVGDHVVVHDEEDTIKSVEDLKTKTVGVNRGSTQEVAARNMQEAGLVQEVRTYDQVDAAYRDLQVRRIDAIITQTIYHQWTIQQNPDLHSRLAFPVDPKYFGKTGPNPSQFPLPKGAPKLKAAVNEIIAEMRENGELERIFRSYGITDPSVWTPPT
jgi:ABC-type amino acid transport substrate-binding protein